MDTESIDDILNGSPANEPTTEAPAAEAAEPEAPPSRPRDEHGRFAPKGENEPAAEAPPAEGAPPAPSDDDSPTVPRKALQDERNKRQGLEEQLRQMQQQMAQLQQATKPPPEPAPDMWENPDGWQQHFGQNVQSQAVNQAVTLSRINMSEMLARQAHPDFQEMFDLFNTLAAENPAIAQTALSDPHPWDKAYKIAKSHKTMQDLGATDVDTLRAKIEAEVRAKVEAEAAAAVQNLPASVPPSLAAERNVGARSGPAWAGPTPLTDLIR